MYIHEHYEYVAMNQSYYKCVNDSDYLINIIRVDDNNGKPLMNMCNLLLLWINIMSCQCGYGCFSRGIVP